MCDNIFKNDKEGNIQTDKTKIIEVWKEHYVELLNVTNRREDLECEKTCGPIPNITLEEVGTQLKKMTKLEKLVVRIRSRLKFGSC